MRNASSSWADSWATTQQALLKGMFAPLPNEEGTSPEFSHPLEAQFTEFQQTWQESIAKWTELLQQGPDIPGTPETLRDMFAPQRWSATGTGAFDEGLRQVLEGPKYAVLFGLDRELLELQQLASRRNKDVSDLRAIVLKAWNTAIERFSNAATEAGAKPTTWRAMADRWVAAVNESLIEAQRSEEFVEAQSKMLRSASEYRLQERRISETWCKALHVPTRTEMDEMQRTVTDLRRQLRAMQRASLDGGELANSRSRRNRGTSPKTSSLPTQV